MGGIILVLILYSVWPWCMFESMMLQAAAAVSFQVWC